MKRSNDHIIAGVGFVALASVVGFALFFVMKASSEPGEIEVAQTVPIAEVAVTEPSLPDQVPLEEADTLPMISAAWLVGTWGPADNNPGNNPEASCDTDVLIKFNADGTYSDPGSEGRYSTDGRTIRYFDRRSVQEIGEEPEEIFVPEPIADISGVVAALDANTFDEDGDKWRRCRGS